MSGLKVHGVEVKPGQVWHDASEAEPSPATSVIVQRVVFGTVYTTPQNKPFAPTKCWNCGVFADNFRPPAPRDPHEIVMWKPSIFGPTYRVPRWALDLHRTLDREARMALARAEAMPAGVPGWARRERAARIRSATALIDQLQRAVLMVGMWTQEGRS